MIDQRDIMGGYIDDIHKTIFGILSNALNTFLLIVSVLIQLTGRNQDMSSSVQLGKCSLQF